MLDSGNGARGVGLVRLTIQVNNIPCRFDLSLVGCRVTLATCRYISAAIVRRTYDIYIYICKYI